MRRLSILALLLLAGCSTVSRDVVTPFGSRPGDQNGPFIILGIVHRTTSTLNRSDARTPFRETVDINVPPGTELIIPAVRGYATGYGSIDPAEPSSNAEQSFTWHPDDHHFGIATINVAVERINAVDTSTTPSTQTARIVVNALLADNNADDAWWASANYTLICLGRHP